MFANAMPGIEPSDGNAMRTNAMRSDVKDGIGECAGGGASALLVQTRIAGIRSTDDGPQDIAAASFSCNAACRTRNVGILTSDDAVRDPIDA